MDQHAVDRQVGAARRRLTVAFVITLGFLTALSVGLLLVDPPRPALAGPLAALLAATVALLWWRFRRYMADPAAAPPSWFAPATVLVGAALWCVAVSSSQFGWMLSALSALLLGDVVAGRPRRQTVLWVVGATVFVTGSGLALVELTHQADELPWIGPLVGAFYTATMWTCNVERSWWLGSVMRLDDARRSAAELATARERLRLADDLHDLLGHALEVVAFKSELAERLLPPDADRARTEIAEVQRVARTAMDDVRALTRGARPTRLTDELAGARAVLDSAGVELTVRGDPHRIAAPAQDVLGRVLREAMTNLLRHAEPTRCSIALTQDAERASLVVINDGVSTAATDDGRTGTGLAGLTRYLGEQLGRLDAEPGADGTFALRASLPVPAAGASR